MKKILNYVVLAVALLFSCGQALAERTFVHPGCSYTQGQLDRMKAMVEARVEPFYTTYLNLLNSEHASLSRSVSNRGSQIKEGSFNGTVGIDGRCAHDLALLWHITGDKRYADKAVEYLNANSYYTNTSSRGTGPLDNGKVNLLIEAAELMRDYDGWNPDDQQRFKDMLTYPYYSNTEDLYSKFANSDDSKNGITFYWNIYNGDASRYGNQGLFGMLAMLAMGVYLDNEVIYDRALRYISGLPHRDDDLPYVSGPALTGKNPSDKGEFQNTYSLEGRKNEIADYGYDELLQYYFYPNGQCQESSRDQGHVLCGVHKFIEFAEIAWNQGDKFYSLFDNRLLKGIEFNYRYNLSSFLSFPDQPEPWEPAGYTTDWDEVTLDNNMYLQTRSRSGRWESIKPSPDGRGGISNVGSREAAYAHYLVRAAEPEENTLWLRRTHDYTLDKYGYETSGTAPSWFYEWNGWGTLTKTLGPWMAGDPVTFVNGERISGIHVLPGEFNAAEYDYYNISEDGEGHTYHKVNAAAPSAYRPDGGVAVVESDGRWVVVDNKPGEWMNYTVSSPVADAYDVYVTYKAKSAVKLGVAVSEGEKVVAEMAPSDSFVEALVGNVMFPAGASVVRLYVEEAGDGLEIASVRVVYNSQYEPSVDFSGYLDSKNKQVVVDWEFTGVLARNVSVLRTPKDGREEVVSENNSLGSFTDSDIAATVPSYSYRLRYDDGLDTFYSDPITMEWGELYDSFDNEDVAEWNIPSGNGSGEFAENGFKVTLTDKGAARLSRGWAFPFHAGNFPILAFSMTRDEGVTMALYSGSNSWNNAYDTFSGKVGDEVFYYDLTSGSFQNSKGAVKTEFSTAETTSVPMQLRFAGPAGSSVNLKWVGTFRNLDSLKEAAENGITAVESIGVEGNGTSRIYNLMGIDCGTDQTILPEGIYIINGKKIVIR